MSDHAAASTGKSDQDRIRELEQALQVAEGRLMKLRDAAIAECDDFSKQRGIGGGSGP